MLVEQVWTLKDLLYGEEEKEENNQINRNIEKLLLVSNDVTKIQTKKTIDPIEILLSWSIRTAES